MQVGERTSADQRPRPEAIVHSDPEIVSGTPVFVGTRVPIDALFDYLAGGEDLDQFLDDFPTVSREQAVGALEIARGTLYELLREAQPTA